MQINIALDPDVETVREGFMLTGVYCPCRLQRREDSKCMCKEFREQTADPDYEGFCHCLLYYKTKRKDVQT